MADLISQFTQHELANFKAAFDVFDINQDGKISTDEIFQVLGTMGVRARGRGGYESESLYAYVSCMHACLRMCVHGRAQCHRRCTWTCVPCRQ